MRSVRRVVGRWLDRPSTPPESERYKRLRELADDKLSVAGTQIRALEHRVGDLETLNDTLHRQIENEEAMHIDWLNDLMENAGGEWDGDESMEAIATKYVRHLEGAVEAYGAMVECCRDLVAEYEQRTDRDLWRELCEIVGFPPNEEEEET